MTDSVNLQVILISKDKILYSGLADSVSSVNERGAFDILPKHKSLVSTIKDKLEIRKGSVQPVSLAIESGLLRVHENQVEIYIFKTELVATSNN